MIDDAALTAFENERGRLFGIAYRMLGSVREAEDVIQDAYIRWHEVEHADVDNPSAYLVRTVTRLCIDTLKSARNRRLEYVGPWLPEPLIEDTVDQSMRDPGALYGRDPEALHGLADDLSTAFLLMLERLSPAERAVFLLRESFDMGYADIARVVDRSEANCRQIARRARQRLHDAGRARPADPEEHDRLLDRFLGATREGDVDALLELLSAEVVAYGDGGGKVASARNPIVGPDHVSRYVAGLAGKLLAAGAELRLTRVNGRTGVLISVEGRLYAVLTIHVETGRIERIYTVNNPEKLAHAQAEG